MLAIFRLPGGTSYHTQLPPNTMAFVPRKGDRVNVAGLGSGKVKSVEWVYLLSDSDKGVLIATSVDIRLDDFEAQR